MTERAPQRQIPENESQEMREQGQSQIIVYAHEQVWTGEPVTNKRGTFEKKYEQAETYRSYSWEGKLWKERKKGEYVLDPNSYDSNNRETVEKLAQNLAENLLSNRNPNLKSPYKTVFAIPPELAQRIKNYDAMNVTNTASRLAPAEEQKFKEALRKAFEQLQK